MARKMKLKVSTRLLRKRSRRNGTTGSRRCRFSSQETPVAAIDYKNSDFLKSFLTERGKILPARISGTNSRYQRMLSQEIRKARTMALLPYVSQGH